jgi:hypothetical protein
MKEPKFEHLVIPSLFGVGTFQNFVHMVKAEINLKYTFLLINLWRWRWRTVGRTTVHN